jgi:hypothetical protein
MKVARSSALRTGSLYTQELWKVLIVWKQKETTRDKNLKQENIMGKLKSSILILNYIRVTWFKILMFSVLLYFKGLIGV